MNDLEIQLAALNELRSFLEQFRDELGDKLIMYGNKFFAIRDAGLSVQVADTYMANFCDPNTHQLRNLIETIGERDLPYVKENIDITEQALAKARRG